MTNSRDDRQTNRVGVDGAAWWDITWGDRAPYPVPRPLSRIQRIWRRISLPYRRLRGLIEYRLERWGWYD